MDSRVIRNHIALAIVKRLGLLWRQKAQPYLLVTIVGDPISYGNGIINIEIGPIRLKIKGKEIVMLFDILLLGNDEVILEML